MGKKTKIDWCDSSWNPVTGCLHGCEYCYARKIAERFGGGFMPDTVLPDKTWRSGELDDHTLLGDLMYHANGSIHVLDEPVFSYPCYPTHNPIENDPARKKAPYPYYFDPTFHRYRLDDPKRWTKPRTIFVCSMADLFGAWVPDEWIRQVLEACDAAPQHRFLFLTKNPSRYKELENLLPLHRYPPAVAEMWFGHSYTGTGDYKPMQLHPAHSRFVSIEPLLHDLSEQDMMVVAATNDWIIIGAETGHRKGKVIPKKSWVDGIVYYAKRNNVPVFMKESLREIMGDDFRQEFPWEV